MTSVTIKNIPEELLERLRERAKENRRSLQAELLTILDHAEQERRKTLTLDEAIKRIRALNLPHVDEAAEIVRADRDAH
ncbi:MAG: Arc family DNA-binding protein [Dehalococcoidia bacterium]